MELTELVLIAFGVSFDAAAVSISGSLCPGKYSKRHCACNAALFFGGFQFLMPVAGFYTANIVAGMLERVNHWAAFLLLSLAGGKMVVESLKKENSVDDPIDGEFFAARNMMIPATATSVDALTIGAGMAFSGEKIWFAAAMMGVVTAISSALCVIIGKKLASTLPAARNLSVVGGVIIILIGVKILLTSNG